MGVLPTELVNVPGVAADDPAALSFAGSVAVEGSATISSKGTLNIDIPIPAGVDKAFSIRLHLVQLGLVSDGILSGQGAVKRTAGGALVVDNATNIQSQGDISAAQLAVLDANTIRWVMSNDSAESTFVVFRHVRSPLFASPITL